MASERKGKIIDGRQGGANIIFDDFIYNRKRVNKNGTVLCKCKHKAKCPSSCLTDELGVLIREPTTHTHDMVIGLATAKVIINDMSKHSREELTPVPKVYEDERKKLLSDSSPETTAIHLPLFHNLQNQLCRQRAKLVPSNPKSAGDVILPGNWTLTETNEPFILINDKVEESRNYS